MKKWQLVRAMSLAILLIPCMASMTLSQPTQAEKLPAQLPVLMNQPSIRSSNVWKRVLGQVMVPVPWKVAVCPGVAPLLCVSYEGKLVGTVEMRAHPVESRADFRKMLKQAGLPSSSVNVQNPRNRDRTIIALKDWIANYYAFLRQERRNEHGYEIRLATQTPQVLPVGNVTGVSYGFAGVKKTGEVQEQRLGYIAFDGRILYVITTAFEPDLGGASFGKLEDLQRFEPYLKGIIARLQVPLVKR
ncbi:MAG: hypothetical protein WCA35_30550 [Kovacikia sp.]